MSTSTDSENDSAPDLNVEVIRKKRLLSVSARPVQHSGSKRSRMSHICGGVEGLLASLNNDDDIKDELTKKNEDNPTFETPHSRQSSSAPGSHVVNKTSVRKSASVTKN